jgi:hypothetical protein
VPSDLSADAKALGRRAARVSTARLEDTDLRTKLRQATVTAWVPYAAGPPVQPAGVTVDEFGAAIIPVIGGQPTRPVRSSGTVRRG